MSNTAREFIDGRLRTAEQVAQVLTPSSFSLKSIYRTGPAD